MARYLNIIIVMTALIALCSGSAIPMWEFLSRGEKMSHLYSMFAKQVSSYCKANVDTPVAKCKHDLLVYGVDKLERMTDLHLDAMDPYQRGANDIIWDSMMEGHQSRPSKKHESTPSPIREPTGPYEKNPLFDDDNDNDYKQNQAASSLSSSSAYANGMDSVYSSQNYPTAAESDFSDPPNNLAQGAATNIDLHFDYPSETVASTTNFLSGPMIIRVRPDGTPVEEDQHKPLPRDDDREAMTIGKNRLPTAQQISANFQVPPPTGFQSQMGVYRIAPTGFQIAPTSFYPSTSGRNTRRTIYASYRTTDRRLSNSH